MNQGRRERHTGLHYWEMDWCLFLLRPSAGLSQGLGEERSIASHCWFVLLRVSCQSQWAPVLPYTTGPEKPCTGNKSVCPLSSEVLKEKKKRVEACVKAVVSQSDVIGNVHKGFQGMG